MFDAQHFALQLKSDRCVLASASRAAIKSTRMFSYADSEGFLSVMLSGVGRRLGDVLVVSIGKYRTFCMECQNDLSVKHELTKRDLLENFSMRPLLALPKANMDLPQSGSKDECASRLASECMRN